MAETQSNLVVKTKTRQTQRNADANADASTMAEAKKAAQPNTEKSPVAQPPKEMVVKPKKQKKQKQKRVAEEPRRPITRAYARTLLEAQNSMGDGANPKNEEMQKNTEATSEREKAESLPISNAKEDMEREGNGKNPSRPNPGPNGGTWQYQPIPTFRPPFNPWHEIAALKHQLEPSQYHQNNLYWKMVAANKRASYHQFQVNKLHEQIHENKRNHEETIKDLIEQLEEASSNKPNDISETDTLTNDNEAIVILDEVMVTLQDQISHPTTEQCVESATPTTEASHTDSVGLMSSKEAEFELKCRIQQEQIEMLQKQLLAAQNQLEEQAVKHRQEQETLNLEISDLKSQLCPNKALHDLKVESLERELKEAKASSLKIPQQHKEQNSTAANEMHKREPLKENETGEQEKMEKEDSLPSTAMSLQEPQKEKDTTVQQKTEKEESAAFSVQESLQSLQDKQKMLNVKVAELEAEVKSLPEIPPSTKKNKKKRNCARPQFHLIGLNIKS
ncbi:TATA element modulatory factor-like [Simochromis diagramma]|uniref:TATA element modulatory factor-like n=1 Tax=Simochromis diagramma TaxID=43689 RepID=UPI001A7E909D|nr:TATA element modulatory factor-like [Simochromis diagramma]